MKFQECTNTGVIKEGHFFTLPCLGIARGLMLPNNGGGGGRLGVF